MCDTLEHYEEVHSRTDMVDMKCLEKEYRGYQRWEDLAAIIKELSQEGFIIAEKNGDEIESFHYADDDVKKVLTKAGEILEIYCYFKVCETGFFDEIACGYRFKWEEDVNNELDLVLTKGFSSLIIECKARSKLDQNFYFKLNSLVDMFGIGSQKILLTTADTATGDNKMQEDRGRLMGVITISEVEDIEDIAAHLLKLV